MFHTDSHNVLKGLNKTNKNIKSHKNRIESECSDSFLDLSSENSMNNDSISSSNYEPIEHGRSANRVKLLLNQQNSNKHNSTFDKQSASAKLEEISRKYNLGNIISLIISLIISKIISKKDQDQCHNLLYYFIYITTFRSICCLNL